MKVQLDVKKDLFSLEGLTEKELACLFTSLDFIIDMKIADKHIIKTCKKLMKDYNKQLEG